MSVEPNAILFDTSALSTLDGPGARTVVFFQGCDTGCVWCHSPHSQPARAPLLFQAEACTLCGRCAEACPNGVHTLSDGHHHINRARCARCGRCIDACPRSSFVRRSGVLCLPSREVAVDTLFEQLRPALALADGITLSGGEALRQADAAIALLKRCKAHGIHTAVETSGLLPPERYAAAAPYVDAWLFGLRVRTAPGGACHTDAVLNTLRLLGQQDHAVVYPRIPMIPGVMDRPHTLRELHRVLTHIDTKEVWLNPWNRLFTHYYELAGLTPAFPSPSEEEIRRCRTDMRAFFARHGYTVIPADA